MPRREIIFHKAWSRMFVSSNYYASRVWPFEHLSASPKECSFAVWSGEGNEKHNCFFVVTGVRDRAYIVPGLLSAGPRMTTFLPLIFPWITSTFMTLPAIPPQRIVSALLMWTKLQLSMYNQVHDPSYFRLRVKPCSSLLSLQRQETFGKMVYGAFGRAMVQNTNLCDLY